MIDLLILARVLLMRMVKVSRELKVIATIQFEIKIILVICIFDQISYMLCSINGQIHCLLNLISI